MIITMQSPFDGDINWMDIPISEDDHRLLLNPFRYIPALFPHLTEAQVEFLATGATPSDRAETDRRLCEMSQRFEEPDYDDVPF